MIVTKTVQMKWNPKNREYYVNRGYEFTKRGDVFTVDASDLPPFSHAVLVVRCDVCGDERTSNMGKLTVNKYSRYYCPNCIIRMQTIRPENKDNHRTQKTNIKRRMVYRESDIDKNGNNIFDELIKLWSIKNSSTPLLTNMTGKTKIWIKCNKTSYHDDYLTSLKEFARGIRCPQCASKVVHPADSFGSLMDEYLGSGCSLARWSKKNKVSPYEISRRSARKVWLTCPSGEHEDFCKRAISAGDSHFNCAYCSRDNKKSYLQEKVEKYISEKYRFEMLFENYSNLRPVNPLTNYPLFFDIEIPHLKIIIEVNGLQHYKPIKNQFGSENNNGKTPEEQLEYQQWRDNFKMGYAIAHGYTFLEIPYSTENSESYKQLIDEAILSAQKAVSLCS